MKINRSTFLYFIPLILVMVFCLFKTPERPLSDFAGYYFGGKELLKGHFMNAYDMEALNFSIAGQGYKGVYVSYAPFPPFTAIVFAPFVIFKVGIAKIIFDIFSCLFFLFTLFRAIRYFALPGYIVLLIPILFYTPLINNIFFGQSYLLLFCLLLEGYFAHKKGQLFLSSFLWGFAILFKVFPAVIFLYLLLHKKYKDIVWLGVSCLLLLLLSVAVNGFDSWQFYVMNIIPKLNAGELNHPFTFAFQSAFMLAKKVFVYDQLLNPQPLLESIRLFLISMSLFKALIVSACIMLTLRNKEDDFLSFSVWIMASMLVSPNGSTYSLILLLFSFLALLNQYKSSITNRHIVFASLLLLFACNLSIQKVGSFPIFLQFPRLYLLLLLFVLLLPRKKKIFHFGLFACISLVLIIPSFFKPATTDDHSSYLLNIEKDLFIYNYEIKNGRLVYYSWDGTTKETVTDIPANSFSENGIAIKNNQVYYLGKQMTYSGDWKKKAGIINGNTIVYLSDKNRGVCFYTLRKMELGAAM